MFSPIQQQVLKHYWEGEFSHITSKAELREVGDGLIKFILNEVSPAEGCTNMHEAVSRMQRSIRDLSELADALREEMEEEAEKKAKAAAAEEVGP